jgi:hypothetical protein
MMINTEDNIVLKFTGRLGKAICGKLKGGINIFCSGKVDNNKYMQVM